MSPYKTAELYQALKLHFNKDQYNFFKYSGKVNCKFIPESHYYIFDKLCKKYKEEVLDFYVSNFLENPSIWVNELLTEESNEIFLDYKKKKQSLTYLFKEDIINLLSEHKDLNETIKVKKDFPVLLMETLRKKINLETLIVLDMISNFFPYWDKKMNDNILWKQLEFKCQKYRGFLNIDLDKMKTILKKEVNSMV